MACKYKCKTSLSLLIKKQPFQSIHQCNHLMEIVHSSLGTACENPIVFINNQSEGK